MYNAKNQKRLAQDMLIKTSRDDHEEPANKVGCTQQTIVVLKQNKYVPSIELAFRVTKAFRVSLE
jgi:DNA-binding XRE family transcriptional regulator